MKKVRTVKLPSGFGAIRNLPNGVKFDADPKDTTISSGEIGFATYSKRHFSKFHRGGTTRLVLNYALGERIALLVPFSSQG